MIIRAATEQDISSIVELLKLSLGESLMPKSEAFWRWKHIDNPFGKSPVLVAEENHQLIGVRAFMRWEWKQGDKIYKAVRAVDTATHPQHQGKGIFKKLTLQLVEQCKSEGVDFIFNTPNTSSMPGYLKMGWSKVGKLPVHIRPRVAWKSRASDFDREYAIEKHLRALKQEQITQYNKDEITTHCLPLFLEWRYAANPNIKYYGVADEQGTSLVIFRLKSTRFGAEFRICEQLVASEANPSCIKKLLQKAIQQSGSSRVTYSLQQPLLWAPAFSMGPMVTTMPLSSRLKSLSFDFWKPTLGDMEVF
jgi:N-acetylglutamate synthase-like GNAT family acetyltransferase